MFTILSVLEDEEYNLEERKMKLFSYIVTHDAGFAPNPFWGYCTLACCKPAIRRTANVGDWIVGLSSKPEYKIIYAMQVKEILLHKDYFHDSRFVAKIPDYNAGNTKNKCGDNIYEYMSNGKYRQLPSKHSNKKNREIEDKEAKKHDLSGKYVLVSKRFHYFGRNAIKLPKEFRCLKAGRGHRNRFSEDVIKRFLKFIDKKQRGRCALPTKWEEDNNSCKTGNSCGSS
jgi:hypothetical protein